MINTLLQEFCDIAASPRAQLDALIARGKKVIGCFPYYAPEELVYAAGMVPFGVWGASGKAIGAAKEYFPSFYCSLAQMNLELGLTGALAGLAGVIATSLCDTLRPLSQNFRVGVPDMPLIFMAHPQNRRPEYGLRYCMEQYTGVRAQLERISGAPITDEAIAAAIELCNASRAARREFVRLAGEHPEAVSPAQRCAVLKSAGFCDKALHTARLRQLNRELAALPPSRWHGARVVLSGIMADSPGLLAVLERCGVAVVADDLAHESRSFRVDVPAHPDPMRALAMQFAAQGQDTLLYDPEIDTRSRHVAQLALDSGAGGVVALIMQFCDPEEIEYPSLKRELERRGVPHIMLGYDQQMTDFGQAETALLAFAETIA